MVFIICRETLTNALDWRMGGANRAGSPTALSKRFSGVLKTFHDVWKFRTKAKHGEGLYGEQFGLEWPTEPAPFVTWLKQIGTDDEST
jgi:hypothetical protein